MRSVLSALFQSHSYIALDTIYHPDRNSCCEKVISILRQCLRETPLEATLGFLPLQTVYMQKPI